MPIQNDFLAFAAGSGANVLTQSAWAALPALPNGFTSGVAASNQVNKALRQTSLIASLLAQFIVDQSGQPAVDDGTIATLEANLISAVQATTPGRLIATRVFTSGTSTYTPTAGTKSVIVEVLGGGGAGGGTPACSAGQISVTGGGSAGSYGKSRITSGFSGVTIVVGAGGAGVAGGAGGNGGTSSFGSLVSAPGGIGSAAGNISTGSFTVFGGAGPGSAAVGANIVGVSGYIGSYGLVLSSTLGVGGDGAPSFFGSGGFRNVSSTLAGNPGVSPGSGGSAAMTVGSSTAQAGGAGAPGIVIVSEYA